MKIAPMLIMLYIIMGGIMLFDESMSIWSVTLNPYNVTTLDNNSAVANYTDNSTSQGAMWNIFWNPTIIGNNGLINLLVQALFLGVGLAIVTTVFVKSDITLLTPGFVALTSAGVLPIIALWNVVHREFWSWLIKANSCCSVENILANDVVSGVTCSINSTCAPAIWLSGLIIGPIAIMWIMACIEWLTARPMT